MKQVKVQGNVGIYDRNTGNAKFPVYEKNAKKNTEGPHQTCYARWVME